MFFMKTLTVGEFKADFSSVLDIIGQGNSVGVSYGRKKKPVAVLSPYFKYQKTSGIKLGLLDEGRGSVKFMPDFKITDTEFLIS